MSPLEGFVKEIIWSLLRQTRRLLKLRTVAMMLVGSLWLMAGFLPNLGVAFAQNTNATIRGQVLDPAGALVPQATVVIVNSNTGVTAFSGTTDSAGAFVAPQIIPGIYKITVTANGLKESVINNLVASVAQVTEVNITMQVGEVTVVISVSAKGEQMDSSTSDISTAISPEDVQNIPLVGRTPENL